MAPFRGLPHAAGYPTGRRFDQIERDKCEKQDVSVTDKSLVTCWIFQNVASHGTSMVTGTHAEREWRVVKQEEEPDSTNPRVVLRSLVDARRSNTTVLDSRPVADHQVAAEQSTPARGQSQNLSKT